MTIKQLNANYLINEDRILFRFNTQDQGEYRLWLTRRITLFILAASAHLLTQKLEKKHSSEAIKAIGKFEKEAMVDEVMQQKDASMEFESGNHFPLGANALLVMNVTCSLINDDRKLAYLENAKSTQEMHSISIDFALPGGANLNLNLPENMMQGLAVLLDQIRQNAGWGEAVLQNPGQAGVGPESDSVATKNVSVH